jgi:hypothetical protein
MIEFPFVYLFEFCVVEERRLLCRANNTQNAWSPPGQGRQVCTGHAVPRGTAPRPRTGDRRGYTTQRGPGMPSYPPNSSQEILRVEFLPLYSPIKLSGTLPYFDAAWMRLIVCPWATLILIVSCPPRLQGHASLPLRTVDCTTPLYFGSTVLWWG